MGTDLPQPPLRPGKKNAIAFGANIEPDVDAARRQRIMIFVILLIVPAINLSSMTQSRLRQRVSEIGVRRAFGSTRAELMGQIIAENLVVTLLAGIVGLLLSVAFCIHGQHFAFCTGVQPDFESAGSGCVDPASYFHLCLGIALLFCPEPDEQRFPGMARCTYRNSERIGRTVALNTYD